VGKTKVYKNIFLRRNSDKFLDLFAYDVTTNKTSVYANISDKYNQQNLRQN